MILSRQKVLSNIYHWIIRVCTLQLFLTFFSLPILIAWGLPLSLLTIFGNIIMVPFLSIFLFLSSCIFFTEFFYIPNNWLIFLCEYTTDFWMFILSWHPTYCLYGFKRPSLFIIIIMGFLFLIVYYFFIRHMIPIQRLFILLSFLIILMMVNHLWSKNLTGFFEISCNNGTVILVTDHGKTMLIDPGCIARNASAASWVEHTLAPFIIKNTGSLHIDYFIILQPRQRLFEALIKLLSTISIKTLIMPSVSQSKLAYNANYISCIDRIKHTNGTIVENIPHDIMLTEHRFCQIKKPLGYKNHRSHSWPKNIILNYYNQKIEIKPPLAKSKTQYLKTIS